MNKKPRLLGIILVLCAGTMWGHTGYFVRALTSRGMNEMSISMLRLVFTFAMMAVGLLILDRGAFRVKPVYLLLFAVTGMVGMVGSSLFYFYAIEMTSMAVAAVLMYTSPTIVMLVSLAVFREKLTWRKALCCIIAFAGAALASGVISGGASYSLMGIFYGCLAGASYAAYSVVSGIAIRRGVSPMTVSLYSFAFAAAAILAVGDIPELVKTVSAEPVVLGIAALQALFTCLAPYVVYTLGIRYAGASNASIMSTVELVVASLIGFVSFGEKISPVGIAGIVLVIGSIVLLNLPAVKKRNLQ